MNYYIKDGLLISPSNKLEKTMDILIKDGKIAGLYGSGEGLNQKDLRDQDTVIIDGKGKWVVPGLIDLHVHFREPGQTYKEDISTGLAAAGAGGFTTVCCMPNTNPVLDNKEVVSYVDQKGQELKGANLLVVPAISLGLEGRELADHEGLAKLDTRCKDLCGRGIAGISDDGRSVEDDDLMLEAMKEAARLKLPVFSHAEEEEIIVERDIKLAEEAGCHLHFCHISTKAAAESIRQAKARGLKITGETAPHYFTLTRDFVSGLDKDLAGRGKVNPPLRTEEDRLAIIEALKDGTLDAIATDHAPHSLEEKEGPFEESSFGFIGLETSFGLGYTFLVEGGHLSPGEFIDKMATGPAEILGIDRGIIEVGKAADLTIIDVENEYEIKPEDFLTKGRSTPFAGMKIKGKPVMTFVEGRMIYNDGSTNS